MEFFALNEQVTQIEAQLASANDALALRRCITLAWQLRQRDTDRALKLARQAWAKLADPAQAGEMPPPERQRCQLRLLLIRAEVQFLQSEYVSAQSLAQRALQGFAKMNDALGCFDTHWLLAWLAHEQGDWVARRKALEAALVHSSADPVRAIVAETTVTSFAIALNPAQVKQQWGVQHLPLAGELHPAAACSIQALLGQVALDTNDKVQAILHLSTCHALALASGQMMRAMVAALKIGDLLAGFNLCHNALEWVQHGLSLARHGNWTDSIKNAMVANAGILALLKRHHEARDILRRAIAMPTPAHLPGERSAVKMLGQLGEQELVCQDYVAALEIFQKQQLYARELDWADLQTAAQIGQARALSQMGHSEAALEMARNALIHAKSNHQMELFRFLAQMYTQYPGLPPPAMPISAASVPLHYLHQALALTGKVSQLSDDLLAALAQEYAKVGDYLSAWRFADQANREREQRYGQDAANRVLAVQASQQSERLEMQDMHARQLEAQARRAESSQETSAILQHLGAIGQEITAHLEVGRVFQVLQTHVHHLLDVSFLAIFLMDEDGLAMNLAFGSDGEGDDAKAMPPIRLLLSDLDSPSVRCVRERRQITVDHDPELNIANWLPDKMPTLSRMSAPLCVAERVLGMITIQSRKKDAYGERQGLIFRTLCAYTAIALSNAQTHGELAKAHQQLQETRQQLVQQEKMAGLGELTAGVAHEINNPTHYVHLLAQAQQVDIDEFQKFVTHLVETDAAAEIMDAFDTRFARLSNNVKIMLNGTVRIKHIVSDLRTFTRLDPAEKITMQPIDIIHSALHLVRANWMEKVEFISEFEAVPEIECWPALLNQALINLLLNACQAIEEKQKASGCSKPEPGQLRVRLQHSAATQQVLIRIEDNGIGIPEAHQARIMEPFFTTKEVGVGMGLGLSTAFGIVKNHGGELRFASTAGQGSCFIIQLPALQPASLPASE
jgi:signal transduction histidine kinase